MTEKELDQQRAALLAALSAAPVFDRSTAPVEDFTCSRCPEDVPVQFVKDRKVRCAVGHTTNGIPVARFRG